jgi:hypothetical protein
MGSGNKLSLLQWLHGMTRKCEGVVGHRWGKDMSWLVGRLLDGQRYLVHTIRDGEVYLLMNCVSKNLLLRGK